MDKPILLVIAGCNGAGKSSYSNVFAGQNFFPFDYDKHFLTIYNSIRDFELREEMAHNKTFDLLVNSIDGSIKNRTNFCYETNFNSTPLHWPNHFKKKWLSNRHDIFLP